jgi:hypothetical protein
MSGARRATPSRESGFAPRRVRHFWERNEWQMKKLKLIALAPALLAVLMMVMSSCWVGSHGRRGSHHRATPAQHNSKKRPHSDNRDGNKHR